MKKIILLAALALAAPLFAAASVSISIVDVGSGWAAINYSATDCNVVAFGLNASVDSSAKITGIRSYKTGESTAASRGFGIFPGTIVFDSNGNVTGWGTPIAPNTDPGAAGTGLGTGTVVLELGTLYSSDANKPLLTGTLCELKVDKCCKMSLTVNPTRCGKTAGNQDAGAVLDDATPLVPTLPSAAQINYLCGCPCRGDANGDQKIRTTDLSLCISLLNQRPPSYVIRPTDSLWNSCCDMNNDSLIRTTDISLLVNVLNSGAPSYTIYCSASTWP